MLAIDLKIGALYRYSHPSLPEALDVTVTAVRGFYAAGNAIARWDLAEPIDRKGRRPTGKDTALVAGENFAPTWVSPIYLEPIKFKELLQ